MTFPNYLIAPAIVLGAVVLDRIFGDPRRWHPLAGFGRIAAWIETRMNVDARPWLQRLAGACAVLLLIVPAVAASAIVSAIPVWGWVMQTLLLYFTLGATSSRNMAAP